MRVGAPTIYTEELAREICHKLGTSSKGLNKLCLENPHWPDRSTIFDWRIRHKEFADMYAEARKNQVEAFVDDIINIADESSPELHLVNRTRIDSRKWVACKLAPKLYGEKTQVTFDPKIEEAFGGLAELSQKAKEKIKHAEKM